MPQSRRIHQAPSPTNRLGRSENIYDATSPTNRRGRSVNIFDATSPTNRRGRSVNIFDATSPTNRRGRSENIYDAPLASAITTRTTRRSSDPHHSYPVGRKHQSDTTTIEDFDADDLDEDEDMSIQRFRNLKTKSQSFPTSDEIGYSLGRKHVKFSNPIVIKGRHSGERRRQMCGECRKRLQSESESIALTESSQSDCRAIAERFLYGGDTIPK
jgi:hypothetical protein